MSMVFKASDISANDKVKIDRLLTLRSETKQKGLPVFGIPFKGYLISEDKYWISVPLYFGMTSPLFKNATPYDFSENQSIRSRLVFKADLEENEKRDQISAMKEADGYVKQYNTVSLSMRTGFGKTICGYYQVCQVKLRTLIVVCRSPLLEGWLNECKNVTQANVMIFDGKKPITEKIDVVICMIGQVEKIPGDILQTFGTLVIDEAVDFCTEQRLHVLLLLHPQYIISSTATPTRPDKLHSILHLLAGTHSVVRTNQTPFTVVRLNTGITPAVLMTDQGADWNFIQYDLFLSEQRNLAILDCLMANHEEHKIVLLTAFEIHVDILVGLCKILGLDVARYCGSQDTYENARILIGTTKKIGVGFDEKNKCATFDGIRIDLLVLVCSTKQEEAVAQFTGRTFRAEFPNVIHFVDKDKRIQGNHWPHAKKWYEKSKGEILISDWSPSGVIDLKIFHEAHEVLRSIALEKMREKEIKTGKRISYLEYLDK